jgi:hypothetical protein
VLGSRPGVGYRRLLGQGAKSGEWLDPRDQGGRDDRSRGSTDERLASPRVETRRLGKTGKYGGHPGLAEYSATSEDQHISGMDVGHP